jgi:hypothetical protein
MEKLTKDYKEDGSVDTEIGKDCNYWESEAKEEKDCLGECIVDHMYILCLFGVMPIWHNAHSAQIVDFLTTPCSDGGYGGFAQSIKTKC